MFCSEMDVIELRLSNGGFKKDSKIPYLNDTEFESRWMSKNPHFPFVVCIPNWNSLTNKYHPIWSYDLAYWLLFNVGSNHINWEWLWESYPVMCWKFEFKEEEDKVKFILRWL